MNEHLLKTHWQKFNSKWQEQRCMFYAHVSARENLTPFVPLHMLVSGHIALTWDVIVKEK